jgi:hypothetical protein
MRYLVKLMTNFNGGFKAKIQQQTWALDFTSARRQQSGRNEKHSNTTKQA